MSKSKSRKKRPPKRVLALPDLEHAKTAVLNRDRRPYRGGHRLACHRRARCEGVSREPRKNVADLEET
jgi:hypothetical protein